MSDTLDRPRTSGRTAPHALSIGFGILTGQVRPGSGITVSDEYRAIPALARASEVAGFDSVWLSEHHGAEDAYLPSLLPMLAAVAMTTQRIGLGTAILIPSLHDPVRIAEDVAVVDQLSQGRVLLGLGLGWRSEEFQTFGVPLSERVGRTREAIVLLRHLWRGDSQPFVGRFYRVDRPCVRPLPYSEGGPPIYLAGSREAPIRRAAALADGLIYSRTGPTAAGAQPTLGHIGDALEWVSSTRLGTSFPIILLLSVALGEDDPWSIVAAGVDHQFLAYARWKRQEEGVAAMSENEAAEAMRNGRSLMIAGNPAAITEELTRWVDAILPHRPLHLVVKLHYPGMRADDTAELLARFGAEVIPALRHRQAAVTRNGMH